MYNIYLESPIGVLEIICDDTHLLEVKKVDKLAKENVNNICNKAKMELGEYFNKVRTKFSVPIKLTGTAFQNKVWEELIKLPYQDVLTYQDLANRVGNPKGVRAVANAVGANKLLIIVPCHRIIGSDKSLTGFSAGLENKIYLLNLEGYEIKQNINLKKSKIVM